MSRSNWKGSAGWQSIDDPTGVLESICLHASSGIGQLCEDYLIQEIGTSNDFARDHYSVRCDFAINSQSPFAGSLSLVARANDYTTNVKKPIIAQQGYIAVLDVANQKVLFLRRRESKDVLLQTTTVSLDLEANVKYTLELQCYGSASTGGIRLKFLLNNLVVASIFDSSGLALLAGVPGLQVQNGSVYINNFAVMELDSNGFAV